MSKKTFNKVDLKTSTKTEGLSLNNKGPVVIQPILTNLMGSPKYTIEVSIDDDNEGQYVEYDASTTDVDITSAVQINNTVFVWSYLRISVSCSDGDSGNVIFMLAQPDN